MGWISICFWDWVIFSYSSLLINFILYHIMNSMILKIRFCLIPSNSVKLWFVGSHLVDLILDSVLLGSSFTCMHKGQPGIFCEARTQLLEIALSCSRHFRVLPSLSNVSDSSAPCPSFLLAEGLHVSLLGASPSVWHQPQAAVNLKAILKEGTGESSSKCQFPSRTYFSSFVSVLR